MPFTIRRTPQTRQGFIEPLLQVSDALPLHMVLIPGGTFTMGSPEDELERSDREGPQHSVTVPQFFVGRYPITQAQYQAMMDTNPATQYEADRFVGPDKPVVGVTWHDAVEFCARLNRFVEARLSKHTDRLYRLPSEAEWEYTCRAGTTTPFYFGKTLTTEVANYDGRYTYGDGPEGEYREATTPVNHFGIGNAFGLSDMHGNVLEWCQDVWHDNYEGAPDDGSAWIEGGNQNRRVLRGGAWSADPRDCRSASCFSDFPVNRVGYIGFRVCCCFDYAQHKAVP